MAAQLAQDSLAGQDITSMITTNYIMHSSVLLYGIRFICIASVLVFAVTWLIQRWQLRRAAPQAPGDDAGA